MVMQLHMHMYCFPLSLHHTRLYPSVVLHRGVFCFGGRAYTKMVITDQHGRFQKVDFSVQCHGHYCTVGTTGVTQVLRVKIHLHRRAYAPESFIGYFVSLPSRSSQRLHTPSNDFTSAKERERENSVACVSSPPNSSPLSFILPSLPISSFFSSRLFLYSRGPSFQIQL